MRSRKSAETDEAKMVRKKSKSFPIWEYETEVFFRRLTLNDAPVKSEGENKLKI